MRFFKVKNCPIKENTCQSVLGASVKKSAMCSVVIGGFMGLLILLSPGHIIHAPDNPDPSYVETIKRSLLNSGHLYASLKAFFSFFSITFLISIPMIYWKKRGQ